jgi:hypothetical protein
MKTERLVWALAALNVVLIILLLTAYIAPGQAQTAASVLRGQRLEIVDDRGRVRASIKLEPPSTVGGVAYPESVILRLVNPDGRPVVKVGASVDGGGLSVIGDTDQTYAILKAEPTGSTLTLLEKDGRRTVLGQ